LLTALLKLTPVLNPKAIAEAVQWPTMKLITTKTAGQLDMWALRLPL
jgi:hypothetical protein